MKSLKTLKVLDLFSGTQSVKKALDNLNIKYEYYGIDIYSPEDENIILDLSQDDVIEKLSDVLPTGWKPDFIWASPVCDKFSIASAIKGGNLYFEKMKPYGIKIREDFEPLKTSQYKSKKHSDIISAAQLSLKLIDNMNSIIKYFNCDFIIENPYSSYIVFYLDPLLIRNRVDYCMYGFDYQKPTAIFSNYILDLKTCTHKHHEVKIGTSRLRAKRTVRTYKERSSVPPLLIETILMSFI